MKYIIVKNRDDKEHAIVFPDEIIHKDVARIHRVGAVRVISAGFCVLHATMSVWGRSESLNMPSRPEDVDILMRDFG